MRHWIFSISGLELGFIWDDHGFWGQINKIELIVSAGVVLEPFRLQRRLLNLAFTDHSVKAAGPFIAKNTDRWNELLLDSKEDRDDGWSFHRDISTWSMYLVFDVLMDLCFGAATGTKEPGENPLKKVPLAFDDFVIYNYPVSKMSYATACWLYWMNTNASIR